MHVIARSDRTRRRTDGGAVLQHLLTSRDRPDGDLVADGHVARQTQRGAAETHLLAGEEGRELLVTARRSRTFPVEAVEEDDASLLGFEQRLEDSGIPFIATERVFELDMLYLGQTHTVSVPVTSDISRIDRQTIKAEFEATYQATYGRLLEGLAMRVVNLKVAVIGKRPKLDLAAMAPSAPRV